MGLFPEEFAAWEKHTTALCSGNLENPGPRSSPHSVLSALNNDQEFT
jgi:hypothetical protein